MGVVQTEAMSNPSRPTAPPSDDLDRLTQLVESIVDSYEPLDMIVHLSQIAPRGLSARCLAAELSLSSEVVVRTLAKLHRAGIVRWRTDQHNARWYLDLRGTWAATIELLVELHECDRQQLLAFVKQVGLDSCRRGSRAASLFSFGRLRAGARLLPS